MNENCGVGRIIGKNALDLRSTGCGFDYRLPAAVLDESFTHYVPSASEVKTQ